MRKSRAIKRFTLWKLKPDNDERREALITMLNRAATFMGLESNEHLYLPSIMTYADGMAHLGEQLGIKMSAHSSLSMPLIARDRKSDAAVLLLPTTFGYVKADSGMFVTRNLVHQSFDEIVELRPVASTQKNMTTLIHAMASYVPWALLITLWLVMAASLVGVVFALFSLQSSFGEMNRVALIIGSVTLLSVIAFGIFMQNREASKNFGLAAMWTLDYTYRRFLLLPTERLLLLNNHEVEASFAQVERGLHGMFVALPRLIIAVIFVVFITLLMLYHNPLIAIVVVSSGVVLAFLSRTVDKRAHHDLHHLLALYERSRQLIFGVYHGATMKQRLMGAYTGALRSERLVIDEAIYFLLPFVLVVGANFMMSLATDRDQQSLTELAVLTLLLPMAYGFIVIMRDAHRVLNFGFDDDIIKTVDTWPKDRARTHVEPIHLHGAIELNSVSFGYADMSHAVVRNFSVAIAPRELVLITGPSGSGKTTLLKILAAIHRPKKGEIIFDGQDARALNLTSLTKSFGVVLDNSDIFVGSIYHNIMCGRAIPKAKLERLLLSHEVFDALLDLPMQLETYVIERGKNISRLERSAILLARALVHEPKFLFLDEIFSGFCQKDQIIVSDFLASLAITRIVTAPQPIPMLRPATTIVLEKIVEFSSEG